MPSAAMHPNKENRDPISGEDNLRANSKTLDQADGPSLSPSSVERVAQFLADSGIKLGEQLPSEGDIMRALSLTRHAVKYALSTLRARGIVYAIPRGGHYLCPKGAGMSNDLVKVAEILSDDFPAPEPVSVSSFVDALRRGEAQAEAIWDAYARRALYEAAKHFLIRRLIEDCKSKPNGALGSDRPD